MWLLVMTMTTTMTGEANDDYGERKKENDVKVGEGKKRSPPKAIAMFCTGGIRCEKATSYAMRSGLFPKDVPIYHLEGGILAYLDRVNVVDAGRSSSSGGGEEDGTTTTRTTKTNATMTTTGTSTFRGECFVFDKRVSVTAGLGPSTRYVSCHGCRGPMDRRLLLPSSSSSSSRSDDDDFADDIVDEEGANDGKGGNEWEEEMRYRELARWIPGLPRPRRDDDTGRYYLPGLTCPRCHASTTRESLERFAERERQVKICEREGRAHFQDRGCVSGVSSRKTM